MAAVRDNKAQNRFELDVEGAVAFANYRLTPAAVIITHTETPRALRGRGVASELVKGALELIRADIFPAQSPKEFALITSNPPYIAEAEMATLQREVRAFEPPAALVSGRDGLDHIRALLRETPRRLSAGGFFIFEIGFGQRELVAKLIDAEVWNLFQVRNDLQGIPRTFLLQKK